MKPTLRLALYLALGFCAVSHSVAADTGFDRGNSLYEARQYAQAAAAYESQVHRGTYSANLFYNLANTYYRLDDRGRAILNYQRTLLLEPAHTEAMANLAFVRGNRDPAASAAESPVRGSLSALGAETWPWLAAVSGWLAAAGLLAAGLSQRVSWRRTGLLVGLAASAAFILCAGVSWYLAEGTKSTARALVLQDKTSARYAPADNAPSVADLSAGNEIRVLAERGAWTYAQFSGGQRGWLPSAKIERLIPRASRD